MTSFEPASKVTLDTMNTLGVKSVAEYFYAFSDVDQLKVAIEWARKHNLALRVLGGGSNALLEPTLSGLVLQPAIRGINCIRENDQHVCIKVGAGENWHRFTQWAISRRYCGLENLSLIPGSVGASPIQNIGAYGVEVSSLIECVEVYDLEQNALLTLSNTQCQFAYRDSLFKQPEGRSLIVVGVTFVLSKSQSLNVSYPALKQHFDGKGHEQLTVQQVADAVIAIRQQKLPSPKTIPNVGSFFKNPVVEKKHLDRLLSKYADLAHYQHGSLYKIAAAWLIDRAGWKGKSIQGVAVHQRQALVVVNPEHRDLDAILAFAAEVQRDIHTKFGIELEIEPQCLPFIDLSTM